MGSPAAKMSSPPAAPNGSTAAAGQLAKNTHHADLMTRRGSRLVNAAIPRSIAESTDRPR